MVWVSCNGEAPNGNDIPPDGLCVGDGDCPEHHVCEFGVCEYYEPPACEINGCPPFTFCDPDGECKASGEKPCSTDEHCGEGFFCPPSIGLCMQACILNADCAPGSTCNNAIGACVECTFDPECTGEDLPYCLSEEGRCVGCLLSGHCPNGRYCDLSETSSDRYTCREGCLDGNDCIPGTRCERPGTEPGQCVECSPSTAVEDCQDGARQRCHPDLRICVSCFMHDHCNVGNMLYCHQDDFVCVQCLEHAHCPKGTVCRSTDSTCVEGCTGDERCPPLGESNLVHCDPTLGTYGECLECLEDDHCELGYKCTEVFEENRVVSRECVEGCSGDHNCPDHKPRCDLVDDRCVECLGDTDCTPRKCDLEEKACTCLRDADACTSSDQCGNPEGWPDLPWWDGTCVANVWCVTQLKCRTTDADFQNISPAPRCALPCSLVDQTSGCPSGFCCRRVKNSEGDIGLKCVSNQQCAGALCSN